MKKITFITMLFAAMTTYGQLMTFTNLGFETATGTMTPDVSTNAWTFHTEAGVTATGEYVAAGTPTEGNNVFRLNMTTSTGTTSDVSLKSDNSLNTINNPDPTVEITIRVTFDYKTNAPTDGGNEFRITVTDEISTEKSTKKASFAGDDGAGWSSYSKGHKIVPTTATSLITLLITLGEVPNGTYLMLDNYTVELLTGSGAVLSTENIAIEDANLTLSPNPVNDMLTIRSSSRIEKVEIYNLLGQRVLTENTNTIDVSNLSKGIYVSKVYLENNSISSKKFIKQ